MWKYTLNYGTTSVQLNTNGIPPFLEEVANLEPISYSFTISATLLKDNARVTVNPVSGPSFGPVQVRECPVAAALPQRECCSPNCCVSPDG